MAYVDGFLIPVPKDKLDAYRATAKRMAPLFKQWGALRVVETIEDDCPKGERNDFHTAVLAEAGEVTVFSWTEWPDRDTRNAAWGKMEEHMKAHPELMDMPFDGKRMIYGGFMPLLDTEA
ncbi:DUF1428 domain-containing protein [Sphingomicrobium aestuariivivum]|uniref:DUF1428 domain-containing protein n=1 Tax=Sphingomicrobium aestuariivivum TaxID=1582356 RepID=UPI001FD6ABA8|nr:DUF1428 domain-containing protein [Sphingomicrobium aestuariivivum]MCJ8190942.1 DUF1428 domain-containing protein [Sphingomicrobium aestuariivivum]